MIRLYFDLYGLYSDFPGTDEAAKVLHLPYERVRKLEAALDKDIGDWRLIPHIQLHEFETILFCDLDALASYFDDCDQEVEALRRDVGDQLNVPELIDDGQESAPSKRIARRFPAYPSRKPDAPVSIASAIDLTVVRGKCPHFDAWLTRLEELGKAEAV